MIFRTKKLFFIAIFAILFTSCYAPIDIETDAAAERLVVFAAFSQDIKRQYVNISKSMPYFQYGKPIAVDDAEVKVTFRQEEFVLHKDTLSGRYFIDNLPIVESEIYILDIYYDFNRDGLEEHYQAKSRMPNSPKVDSVRMSDLVIEKMPILLVYGEAYHTTENNYCLYNWRLHDTIGVFDYFMMMPEYMMNSDFQVFPLPYYLNGEIRRGDTLCFRVDNFNNQYAVFISQCMTETGVPTPIFSDPPAEVYTNIRCLSGEEFRVSGIFTTFSRGKTFEFISTVDFDYSLF